MKPDEIIDKLLEDSGLDLQRLGMISAKITSELDSGTSGNWDVPFDQYIADRMDDLAWQGGSNFEDEYDEDRAYDEAKKFILSDLQPDSRARHEKNRK